MRKNTSFEKVGDPAVNFFVPLNQTTFLPVPGLSQGDFTYEVWNPLNIDVSGSMSIEVAELGSGNYIIVFTPTMVGEWTLVVKHPTYMISGKRASYRVFDALYYVENQDELVEPFAIVDSAGILQPGVPLSEISVLLYNPSRQEVSSSVPVTLQELGGGTYRARYTANENGKWLLVITHATYFPWGKRNDQRYTAADPDFIDIVEAMRNLIVQDTDMRARLATFEFTTGVLSPAVFTTPVIPQDCDNPAVIISRVGGTDFGTRSREGEDTFVEVRVYGDRLRPHDVLRRTATILSRLLDRARLTMSDGFEAFRCIADPPVLIPDPDGFPAYMIAVRALQLG
jgi:hypothetical protein